jgi:SAM-dependent methyltransferase
MNCRACKCENLYRFLDLGNHPPSDQFRKVSQINQEVIFYPLNMVMCENCGQAQLGYIVDPTILYQDDYPYESATTKTARDHYFAFSKAVVNRFNVESKDYVMDIGSNVGILLDGFKKLGAKVQGVDPAKNICDIANKNGIPTYQAFFDESVALKLREKLGRFKVIVGTNVFAHIDDWDSLIKGVNKLLIDKGIFIIESPHFLHLLKSLEYDTIYHEHLSYISIEPLIDFFDKFGMEIFMVENQDIHGGSIRVFISRKGDYSIDPSVKDTLESEVKYGTRDHNVLDGFAEKVERNRLKLVNLLHQLKAEGKSIVGVSAPAKGMTLINYCKIGKETLNYITEKSKLKIGRISPGDNIPIFSDDKLLETQPDYALLLAWNFSDEIISNLKEYRLRGGKFIIPIPEPKIIK